MDKKLEKQQSKTFGLIGKNISYSFSQQYFTEKFKNEKIDHHSYQNFDFQVLEEIKSIIEPSPKFNGLNVTIPYKEEIIPYLDKVSSKALRIGAVNTIRITKKGKLKGYNTDEYGFRKSLHPLLKKHHKKALILGTGGASKAVAFALKKMHIKYQFVSRNDQFDYDYSSLTPEIIAGHHIIINCTPVGTFPKVDQCPDIPYEAITKDHILYDLIYNPEETLFLSKGKSKGATICNGLQMLLLQAEKAWEIWNK